MDCFNKNWMTAITAGVFLLSFQGCDQVQKFVEYLSPNRKPAEQAIQPVQQPPQEPAPKAPSEAKDPASNPMAPGMLAQVGDWSITIQKFNEQLNALKGAIEGLDPKNVDQRKAIFTQMIQQQLLVQEALSQKLDQGGDFISAMEEARNTLLIQALAAKELQNIVVSDEEAKTFYEENKEMLTAPTEWRISEIVVKSEEEAKAVLVEVNQGASFEEIAKTRSIAKSAANGGDLGFLMTPFEGMPEQMPAFPFDKMAQVVATLDIGAVSGVLKGPEGFYIVKLVERKDGELQPFEDIKEDLKAYMVTGKQQQIMVEILARAEQKFKVNINEQLLEEQNP